MKPPKRVEHLFGSVHTLMPFSDYRVFRDWVVIKIT